MSRTWQDIRDASILPYETSGDSDVASGTTHQEPRGSHHVALEKEARTALLQHSKVIFPVPDPYPLTDPSHDF